MPKEYLAIPKILETSSRRVITRALVVPSSKRVNVALLAGITFEDQFSILFVDYSFREKSRGKIEERIEINREIGSGKNDPEIIRAMEKIMPGWEKISPTWVSNRERVMESLQGSLRQTSFGDRIHEAMSRIQMRVHFEAQHVSLRSLAFLIQTFDQRLGAMLAENRAW